MEGVLSQRLTQYFECLLGDQTTHKSIKTDSSGRDKSSSKDTSENGFESRKKKKMKKQKKVTAKNKKNDTIVPDNESHGEIIENIRKQNHISKDTREAKFKDGRVSEDGGGAGDKGFTDDGFKIVSSIPEDDLDVSDAFESCSEEEDDTALTPYPKGEGNATSARKPRETEDGFKIMSEIPPDDSDVSDAFGDDEDNDFVSMSLPDRQRHMKKPLIQIMKDFGIDGKALTDKREETPKQLKLSKKQKKLKKGQANTLTQAAKRKKQEDVLIIDFAKKRGANKERKSKEEEEEVQQLLVESKPEALDEKQLKRVRYDVFKLGMSGFHKEKKEDTRVALAIKLGAKPPRNKAVNYKKFQEIKKEERKKEAEEKEMKLKLGLKVPKPFKKKEKPIVKAAASQIGRYRHGVQVISKRDISKISKS